MILFTKDLYVFNARVLTHVLFWVSYYLLFSFVWAREGALFQSFQLELLLMPIRIAASYISMYYLIPVYLARGLLAGFLGRYLLLILIAGIAQRFLNFFFHEYFFQESYVLWSGLAFLKSAILINTTVMLLSTVRIYKYWMELKRSSSRENEKTLEIRSEKRFHRVKPSSITYIEGLGNYVTIYLEEGKNLIAYMTLKEAEEMLPRDFQRVHRSFIVNTKYVSSFNHENVDVGGRIIPIGKSYHFH